jgi:hypothetical protein
VDPGQVAGRPGQARVAALGGRAVGQVQRGGRRPGHLGGSDAARRSLARWERIAAHLPGARYFEQPGDHLLWLGDTDAMFGQIREFLGEAGATPGPDAKTDRSSPSPAAPAAG